MSAISTLDAPCGPILGRRRGGVLQFLGIPFAEPPIGPLRFAAPRRLGAFDAPFAALAYGAGAPQRRSLPKPLTRLAGTTVRFAEDCLNLNVWTPSLTGSRPVLVFIHGGGFIIGSGAQYPGDDLCRRGDVVVVTMNYRLGLLGFNGFSDVFPGDERFASNAGLRDQILALEWVRDNIAAFGGDPNQVTIAGESAGAVSVAVHLVHAGSQALFHRAILQSGGLNLLYPREEARRVTRDILDVIGAVEDPERLFRLSPKTLARSMSVLSSRHLGILTRPTVDGDLVPDAPLEALYRRAKPVPMIVGTNRDEFSFFSELPMFPVPSGIEALAAVVEPAAGEAGTRRLRALYPDTREGRIALGTDIMFRMPAIHLADIHCDRAPTFAYRLDWAAKGFLSKLGATHSVDLPLLFEGFLKPMRSVYLGVLPDFRRQALAVRMREHWLAFVTGGAPGADWPPYERTQRRTKVFAVEDRVVPDPDAARREAYEGVDGFTV